ncbi:hypothetical protein UCRPA7_4443 [Phaeoacremonium minimum UCRPA7]|uniref:MARVEL domain-containing protein n=1 Tax=Phaeoacremonium minimum (strain UCR-PA7) TaxID=1286976 RepID=R8BL10_PHAM7|nr:hypothetical protein UCRPA7_4443 [Phaeoacremonium minimum UCRPA7]EOO00096.1 hypothetical protein UCRPA7_4443 [Phaeoacremonium minimum UCRPA7]
MVFNIVLPLRGAQLLFGVIVLGLSGYVANWYNVDTLTSSPSEVNFLIFVPLWSFITIGYIEGISRFVPKFYFPIAAVVLEVSNIMFYFGGFVALAVFLSRLLFCRGMVCAAARADTAFASFGFVMWAATAAFTIRDFAKTGLVRRRSPAGLSGPAMKEAAMAA